MPSRSASIRFTLLALASYSAEGINIPAETRFDSGEMNYDEGIGYTQIDVVESDERTLAAGANEDIDLVGVLTDGIGVQSPAKIVLIAIINYSTTQTLQASKAASNGWAGFASGTTDTFPVDPAYNASRPGMLIKHSPRGVAVTAGTGDKINIANPSGATATYRIIVLGRSA